MTAANVRRRGTGIPGTSADPVAPSAQAHRFTCTTFAGGKPLKWVELAAE
jgi:hypothetical protein